MAEVLWLYITMIVAFKRNCGPTAVVAINILKLRCLPGFLSITNVWLFSELLTHSYPKPLSPAPAPQATLCKLWALFVFPSWSPLSCPVSLACTPFVLISCSSPLSLASCGSIQSAGLVYYFLHSGLFQRPLAGLPLIATIQIFALNHTLTTVNTLICMLDLLKTIFALLGKFPTMEVASLNEIRANSAMCCFACCFNYLRN